MVYISTVHVSQRVTIIELLHVATNHLRLGSQMTAASWEWGQVIPGLLSHKKRELSSPVHSRPTRWTNPVPGPYVLALPERGVLPVIKNNSSVTNNKVLSFCHGSCCFFHAGTCPLCSPFLLPPKSIYILYTFVPSLEYPACLQATLESSWFHRLSHTVPQLCSLHTSTRPSQGLTPPTILIEPLRHPANTRNAIML